MEGRFQERAGDGVGWRDCGSGGIKDDCADTLDHAKKSSTGSHTGSHTPTDFTSRPNTTVSLLNNDGASDNDLLFIPTSSQLGQLKFSGNDVQQTAQRAGFESYIQQDKYLSSHRGQVAEKFTSFTPWFSTLDVRVLQEYRLPNTHAIQLSLDILNFGNLLNSNWGVRQFASYTGLAQPLGVSTDSKGVPTYSFDTSQKTTFFNDSQLISRWRMQVGLRYSF